MFRDGYLTYDSVNALFRNWRPEGLLYELLFAAVVTVLVYQLTKLILEVGLGQRRRGEILVSDLYIYMIVSGLSLSAIISSFRSEEKHCQEGSHGRESYDSVARSAKSGRAVWVLVKFIVLLIVIPSIQILGIFLGMERVTDLSFGDLNFGGLAIGIQENTSAIRMSLPFNGCEQVESNFGHGETEGTIFFRCETRSGFIGFDKTKENNITEENFIVILRSSTTDIGVTVVVPDNRWISSLHLDMHDGKQPYFLKNSLTPEERSQIFENGVRRMVAPCESPVLNRDINISWVIPPAQENEPQHDIEAILVECAGYDKDELVAIAQDMLSTVTFVGTERFDVTATQNRNEFVSGDDIIFIHRRGSNVSLMIMMLMIAGVVLARFVIELVLNNEGSFALDVILKDEFGLNCCDSMLQYEQSVYFGRNEKLHVMIKPASSKMHSSISSEEESASSASSPDDMA